MEIFARVVEARSLSRAATRLRISRSAVSKHLARMERSMGVRLLNRTTRSLSLTEVGREFYECCARMLAHAEEAVAVAADQQAQPRGRLKVNVPVAFGVLHIAPALSELMSRHPDLVIEMTFDDRRVPLVGEGYDVAVTIEAKPEDALVARRLAPIRHRVCASPDYLQRHGSPQAPEDLAAHNCLVYARVGDEDEWTFESASTPTRVRVGGNVRLNNENAIRQAALAGLGLALLPTYIVDADIRRGDLRATMPAFAAAGCSLYAVFVSNRQLSPKVRVFIDFLLDRFGPEPYWDRSI